MLPSRSAAAPRRRPRHCSTNASLQNPSHSRSCDYPGSSSPSPEPFSPASRLAAITWQLANVAAHLDARARVRECRHSTAAAKVEQEEALLPRSTSFCSSTATTLSCARPGTPPLLTRVSPLVACRASAPSPPCSPVSDAMVGFPPLSDVQGRREEEGREREWEGCAPRMGCRMEEVRVKGRVGVVEGPHASHAEQAWQRWNKIECPRPAWSGKELARRVGIRCDVEKATRVQLRWVVFGLGAMTCAFLGGRAIVLAATVLG